MSRTSAALVRTQAVSPALGATGYLLAGDGSGEKVGRRRLPGEPPEVSGVYRSRDRGYEQVTGIRMPRSPRRGATFGWDTPGVSATQGRASSGSVADQGIDELLGLERREVVGSFPEADQLDRYAEIALD